MRLKHLTIIFFFTSIIFLSDTEDAKASIIQTMNTTFSGQTLGSGVSIPVSGRIDYYGKPSDVAGGQMDIGYSLDGGAWVWSWQSLSPYPCCGQDYSFSIPPLASGSHTIQFVVFIGYFPSLYLETYSTQTFTAAPLTAKITTPSVGPTTFGNGTTIYFSGVGEGGNSSDGLNTYEWREGSCTTGTLLSSSASFQKNNFSIGSHTVYLRVKDSSGAWSTNCPSSTVVISANNVPVAYITSPLPSTITIHKIKPGDTLSFSGYGTDLDPLDTIIAYRWSNGGPYTYSTSASFTNTFASTGTYYVYLLVKDSNNNWSTNNPYVNVMVVTYPAATLYASPTTCTIASGASTCDIPFTWNIVNISTLSLYNTTTGANYTSNLSGTAVPYPITNGSNHIIISAGAPYWSEYASVNVTGSCAAGSLWNGTICASTSVNGACGTSHLNTFSTAPSTNLCSSGSATTVFGTGPWGWTCNGSGGGTNASCQAFTNVVAGECGTANGVAVAVAPSANLCSSSSITPTVSGAGPWAWACIGFNGGGDVSCSAPKSAATKIKYWQF